MEENVKECGRNLEESVKECGRNLEQKVGKVRPGV